MKTEFNNVPMDEKHIIDEQNIPFKWKHTLNLILGVPRGTRAKMMKHELQMIPVEHRASLLKIEITHTLYYILHNNRRQ